MKYLIAGLGNPGDEYAFTRHNVGFQVLDYFSRVYNLTFEDKRYAQVSYHKIKNKEFYLIKPSTYMNLSGKAVRFWMNKLKVPLDKILVITDDIALPLGKIRLKGKGSDGGHNGLKNIIEILQDQNFPRLRFGIGGDFLRGKQVNFVLGKWSDEELEIIKPKIELSVEIIKSFAFEGIHNAMSKYNNN